MWSLRRNDQSHNKWMQQISTEKSIRLSGHGDPLEIEQEI